MRHQELYDDYISLTHKREIKKSANRTCANKREHLHRITTTPRAHQCQKPGPEATKATKTPHPTSERKVFVFIVTHVLNSDRQTFRYRLPIRCAPATTSGFSCAATNRTCRSTDRYPEPAFILLARALSLDSACSIFCFLLFFVLMTFFYSPGRTPTLSSACIQSLRTTVRKARFWAGKYRSEARTIFPSKFTTILLLQKSITETETCRRTSLSLLY